MAMAAGKSAGKPPRMTDKAFKPPTEAAMAMTGHERLAGETGVFSRAALAGCFWLRSGLDFVFMIICRTYSFTLACGCRVHSQTGLWTGCILAPAAACWRSF